MERIYCLLIGYVFGLFQTAYIYGRANGIDIRKHGSGNAGTTNALRVLGKKAGFIVLLGDALKCILAIVTVTIIFQKLEPDMIYLLKLYGATGAILGHNFPFFLKFRGGKGIAATAGLVIAFHWYFLPVACILFFGALFFTHYVSLGSLLVYTGFMIELIILGQMGIFKLGNNLLIELYLLGAFLTIMAFVKHRENIGRLLRREERKTFITKSNKDK
ncbi:MAG TPA: glycerol-3-phosphate 1-O-acyltransferase PlsY [Lachnospiraceae bacterium]|nr:glycerol-3-phosphate 1-O-acyltransferase PlsY [Lachnospiraceae bacterium]